MNTKIMQSIEGDSFRKLCKLIREAQTDEVAEEAMDVLREFTDSWLKVNLLQTRVDILVETAARLALSSSMPWTEADAEDESAVEETHFEYLQRTLVNYLRERCGSQSLQDFMADEHTWGWMVERYPDLDLKDIEEDLGVVLTSKDRYARLTYSALISLLEKRYHNQIPSVIDEDEDGDYGPPKKKAKAK